ncbi:MAG TPA: hypothetical protein VK797_23160 [Tepidisphaeraceae bacterium]|jgi:hypothetical protein|nr:hypothetical protein [Tepidisphaeraceae bacterium]
MLVAKKRVARVASAAKRKPKKAKGLRQPIESLRQLAAALGKSHTALEKLAKRDDWPFKPPYPVAEVKAWCELNAVGPAGETKLTPERDVKLKLLGAKLAKMELEYQIETQAMVSRDEVERENVKKVMAVRNELMNTPRLMAMLAPCTNDVEREAAIRQFHKGICDRFAGHAA